MKKRAPGKVKLPAVPDPATVGKKNAAEIAKKLKSLKVEVREKIANGEPIDKTADDQNLASRDVQVRIAELEAKVETALKKGVSQRRRHKMKDQLETLQARLDPKR